MTDGLKDGRTDELMDVRTERQKKGQRKRKIEKGMD